MRLSVARALVVCLLLVSAPCGWANDRPYHAINGTFLQLLKQHNQWRVAEWQRLFLIFERLGLQSIIVQWSALQDTNFHGHHGKALSHIMRLADEHHMRVVVGLAFDPAYWQHVATPLNDRKAFLATARQRSEAQAERLTQTIVHHRSFHGWYIPEEIDDLNWLDSEAADVLTHYVSHLSKRLLALTPNSRIYLSGFASGHAEAEQIEALWRRLFAAGVNGVLFQDGIGVGKLSFRQASVYYRAVARAADHYRAKLWPVIELFTEIKSVSRNEAGFHAVAADLSRVCSQLATAMAFSNEIVSFAVPNYMSPTAHAAGRKLYYRYLREGC